MKFENHVSDKTELNDESGSNKIKKAIKIGALGFGILAASGPSEVKAFGIVGDGKDKKTKIEENIEEVTPDSYDLSKICQPNMEDLTEKKSLSLDSVAAEKILGKSINPEDIFYSRYASHLFNLVEEARSEVRKIINSETYLLRLKDEFGCTTEEARKHQLVRSNNIENINYNFFRYDKNSKRAGGFIVNSNIIILPYNLKYDRDTDNNRLTLEDFSRIARHEFWHAATNGDFGLSKIAKELLSQESFEYMNIGYLSDIMQNSYQQDPSERYVRFKALESELEKFGIKRIGDMFTREHFDEMIKNYPKFNENAQDFIKWTNGYDKTKNNYDADASYEIFKKIFNNIAFLNQRQDIQNKDYKHPDWNYKNPTNQA